MYIADFHIHSKYSKATSKSMNLEEISKWAKYKGVDLLGSADFTHFLWYHELNEKLEETEKEGIYSYGGTDFILTAELAHIYEKNDRAKKVHNIVFISSLEKAARLNRVLERYTDLNGDGRPIVPFEAKEIVKIVQDVDDKGFVVPAHIWTPHFSMFGSNSGFNTVEECFEEMSGEIFAIETGLSSDPEMNWMLSALDRFTLISNSDAHSPWKIGREANVFDSDFTFSDLKTILKYKNKHRFLFTVEYYPEEGKYHFDGHRNCGVSLSPEDTIQNNYLCPVCKRSLTVGVLHRVCELADRQHGASHKYSIPFKKIVPLAEIIAFLHEKPSESVSVRNKLVEIISNVGSELDILIKIPLEEMKGRVEEGLLEAIGKMRRGQLKIRPGYDGEFGRIEISVEPDKSEDALSLF